MKVANIISCYLLPQLPHILTLLQVPTLTAILGLPLNHLDPFALISSLPLLLSTAILLHFLHFFCLLFFFYHFLPLPVSPYPFPSLSFTFFFSLSLLPLQLFHSVAFSHSVFLPLSSSFYLPSFYLSSCFSLSPSLPFPIFFSLFLIPSLSPTPTPHSCLLLSFNRQT